MADRGHDRSGYTRRLQWLWPRRPLRPVTSIDRDESHPFDGHNEGRGVRIDRTCERPGHTALLPRGLNSIEAIIQR